MWPAPEHPDHIFFHSLTQDLAQLTRNWQQSALDRIQRPQHQLQRLICTTEPQCKTIRGAPLPVGNIGMACPACRSIIQEVWPPGTTSRCDRALLQLCRPRVGSLGLQFGSVLTMARAPNLHLDSPYELTAQEIAAVSVRATYDLDLAPTLCLVPEAEKLKNRLYTCFYSYSCIAVKVHRHAKPHLESRF